MGTVIRRVSLAITLCAAALALPSEGWAQTNRPLRIDALQGITFGLVLPAIPSTVLPTDAVRAAQVRITGPNRGATELHFILPAMLVGPEGASAPIVFGSADGGYSPTESVDGMVRFDPNDPFVATLSSQGRGTIYLGGRLFTVAGQRAGTYTATVIITVINTGL